MKRMRRACHPFSKSISWPPVVEAWKVISPLVENGVVAEASKHIAA
jgi:hypothetical protein